jgi:hypothetical protein
MHRASGCGLWPHLQQAMAQSISGVSTLTNRLHVVVLSPEPGLR